MRARVPASSFSRSAAPARLVMTAGSSTAAASSSCRELLRRCLAVIAARRPSGVSSGWWLRSRGDVGDGIVAGVVGVVVVAGAGAGVAGVVSAGAGAVVASASPKRAAGVVVGWSDMVPGFLGLLFLLWPVLYYTVLRPARVRGFRGWRCGCEWSIWGLGWWWCWLWLGRGVFSSARFARRFLKTFPHVRARV